MNRLEVIQTPNRRLGHADRRQCTDRRRHARLPAGDETVRTLRELLDQAHVRIRSLERTLETLKQAI